MYEFRESVLLLYTTPVYIILIGSEMLISYWNRLQIYTVRGFLSNVFLSTFNFCLDIIVRGLCLYCLNKFYSQQFITWQSPFLYWFVLLIGQDFLFYLLHYMDHHCRLFWAVHVTHHSSEEFNLSVGFRSSVLQPLYRFIYFIPLSMAGFESKDIMLMYSVTQLYGILIHTQLIGKLGFLEGVLATPSNHRVHHGSNIRYLDRNMGMVFIIWDRLFGTYTPESEPVKFGLTKNLINPGPFQIIFHEWKSLWKDLKKPVSFYNRIRYAFGQPGWSHDGSTKTSDQLRGQSGVHIHSGNRY